MVHYKGEEGKPQKEIKFRFVAEMIPKIKCND